MFSLLRPYIFGLDPEVAHDLAIKSLKFNILPNAFFHIDEEEMLEALPLPGNPQTEKDRKAKWLLLPRRARIAIRRLHRNFKHLPKQAMIQMLRASRAPKIYIDVAKAHRCAPCEQTKPKPPTHKVSAPKPYDFLRGGRHRRIRDQRSGRHVLRHFELCRLRCDF